MFGMDIVDQTACSNDTLFYWHHPKQLEHWFLCVAPHLNAYQSLTALHPLHPFKELLFAGYQRTTITVMICAPHCSNENVIFFFKQMDFINIPSFRTDFHCYIKHYSLAYCSFCILIYSQCIFTPFIFPSSSLATFRNYLKKKKK